MVLLTADIVSGENSERNFHISSVLVNYQLAIASFYHIRLRFCN